MFSNYRRYTLPCNTTHNIDNTYGQRINGQFIWTIHNAFEIDRHVERTVSRKFTSNAPRETKLALLWQRGVGMALAESAWLIPVGCGGAVWRKDQPGKPECELTANQPLHSAWGLIGQQVALCVLINKKTLSYVTALGRNMQVISTTAHSAAISRDLPGPCNTGKTCYRAIYSNNVWRTLWHPDFSSQAHRSWRGSLSGLREEIKSYFILGEHEKFWPEYDDVNRMRFN